jgi:hypothetical protein
MQAKDVKPFGLKNLLKEIEEDANSQKWQGINWMQK